MSHSVLVVDDEVGVREMLCDYLGAHGFETHMAGNGAEALDAIRRLKPDLVFLDVQMPGMDGFEVLRALDSGERPTIVFVTAHDQYAVPAFEERALDYLLKPFAKRRFERPPSRRKLDAVGNTGCAASSGRINSDSATARGCNALA